MRTLNENQKAMKTKVNTAELIECWNNLPPQEKMAMGEQYIIHETNLKAWDKPFEQLSKLKQKRVLQRIEEFAKVRFHGVIGSGIK